MLRKSILMVIVLIAHCHPVSAMEKGWHDYFVEGTTYYQAGDYQQAERAYQKALTLNPTNPKLFQDLGDVLHIQGKVRASLKYYDKAISLDPENALAYFNRGVVKARLGQTKAGDADIKRACDINPQISDHC